MLCVIDHKSPCEQGCPYRYREGGCFWEDARRAGNRIIGLVRSAVRILTQTKYATA